MPHTHGRLQNLRVGLNAEAFESLPHTGNHQRRREMRVGSGGARRNVFVRGEELAQFVGGLFPLPRRMRLKDVCHCAPPAITRENGFFLAGASRSSASICLSVRMAARLKRAFSRRLPSPILCAAVIRKSRDGLASGSSASPPRMTAGGPGSGGVRTRAPP